MELIGRWNFLDSFVLNGSYSFVSVSKMEGIQVNTTSPHAATASLDYRLARRNYRLSAVLSASYMGRKHFDVQDRLVVGGMSRPAWFRCTLPAYTLFNLSVSQTFSDRVKLTVGAENIFGYVPRTLGSGITMYNIPATAGARGFIQLELLIDESLWKR